MAKRFYILRHGKTVQNEANIKQGVEGDLNEAGQRQAHLVGKALSQVEDGKITCICSSPYPRALQTAEIIKSYINARILSTPLLAERKNPSEVIGLPVDDPDVQRVTGLIEKGYHDDDYRFSDEENFLDLKKRARECLWYLARHGTRRTCVVTHHAFLQMLLCYMQYREALDAKSYAKLAFFNPTDNASITICEFEWWGHWFSPTKGWKILAYNQIVREELLTKEELKAPDPFADYKF